MACGDDGNTCIGLGCNDEVGEIGGGEDETGEYEPPCYPELASVDDPDPAIRHACDGTGIAWAEVKYRKEFNKLETERHCYKPPEGVANPKVPEQCLSVDLTELAVPPRACCTADADDLELEHACNDDCAYAACARAVVYLEEMAGKVEVKIEPHQRAKDGILAFAETLSMPDQQELCAKLVANASANGETAVLDLGEAPAEKDKPGHIENLTLYMRCDIDSITALPDARMCTRGGNTPNPLATTDRDGLVFGGEATYVGPEHEGHAALTDGAIAVQVPTCNESPCTLTVSQLSGRFENVQVGDIELTAIRAELTSPAQAWLEDDSLRFPAGALRFDVQALVRMGDVPLSEVADTVMHVTNLEPAIGSFTDDGVFTLEQAKFGAGEYEVILHVEPSPTSLIGPAL
ncbi:MAG: hypothetical protein HC927_05860 [Deltaproteobacteria bacterium]|nr:hypothetical protein [Deltaproteobacteria bacterium]